MARTFNKQEPFQVIFNWVNLNLTTEEVNKLLLDTDNEGRTFFHVAADFCLTRGVSGILIWAK